MSTVVYVKTNSPDKKLIKEHVYHYHPDSEMRDKIMKDIAAHSNEVLENFIIDIKIEVSLKQYDTSVDKSHWYEKYPYNITTKPS